MWIIDMNEAAVNLDKCISIYSHEAYGKYVVTAWETGVEDAACYHLADFEKLDDANKYIAELVEKLNAEKKA